MILKLFTISQIFHFNPYLSPYNWDIYCNDRQKCEGHEDLCDGISLVIID